jgi:glycosyltransferase involved in cell wall biosynthesis
MPKYSIIIPVYNRPQEVEELLSSLVLQTFMDFEVILVEDGSTKTSKEIFEKYSDRLALQYFYKHNSGPGPSRNFGFEKASGDYFVVFDSDCIIPPHYLETVEKFVKQTPTDAWGGPDRGGENFTALQRAMAYTMASVLTTGGIRGGAAHGFLPRSFNMGMRKEVFFKTGGFQFDRLAEDIEFSYRIREAGFRVNLIPEAYVFHKRRTNFRQFFQQVAGFGKGRVRVWRAHPGSMRITHWFPSFFLAGVLAVPVLVWLLFPLGLFVLLAYFLYFILIAIDAWVSTKSMAVSLLSIPSAFIQLTGYGSGFLREMFRRE